MSRAAMARHAPRVEGEPVDPSGEFLSEHGAFILANRIRAFWKARGFSPKVWVARGNITGEPDLFVVRSNIRNGRPV